MGKLYTIFTPHFDTEIFDALAGIVSDIKFRVVDRVKNQYKLVHLFTRGIRMYFLECAVLNSLR